MGISNNPGCADHVVQDVIHGLLELPVCLSSPPGNLWSLRPDRNDVTFDIGSRDKGLVAQQRLQGDKALRDETMSVY